MQTSKLTKVESGDELTAQPLTVPNGADNSDWLRLPKPKQRLWGMNRTTWNELLDGGKIKGITLRKKHARRGIKLIFRPSAEAYLKSLLDSNLSVRTEALLTERQDAPLTLRRAPKIRSRRRRAELIAPSCPL